MPKFLALLTARCEPDIQELLVDTYCEELKGEEAVNLLLALLGHSMYLNHQLIHQVEKDREGFDFDDILKRTAIGELANELER